MSADPLIPPPPVVRCRGCHRVCRHGTLDGYGPRCAEDRGLVPHPMRLPRPVRESDGPNLLDLIEGDAVPQLPTTTVAEAVDPDLTEQIAWTIHSCYPCEVCSCGQRRCEKPRFREIQAAARIVSNLTSAGLLSGERVRVEVTHVPGTGRKS